MMDHLSEQEGDLLPAACRAVSAGIATTPEPRARVLREQDLVAGSMDALHRATAPA